MGVFLLGVTTIFSRLVDHSIEISALICLIFLVKWIVAKKLPSWWHYSLWLMLLVRMLIPIEFENSLNVFNFIPDIREHQVFEMIADSPPAKEIQAAEILTHSPADNPHWRLLLKSSVPLLWLAGTLVFGICILLKSISFWNSVRCLPPIADRSVLDLLEQCKQRMKIDKDIDVIVTDSVRSPALFGYFHPRLLLPKGIFERLGDDDLSYAFMHELGHLKRHDIGVSWLTAVLQVGYWFNPLVWLAFHHMRLDQESACDESVLSNIKRSQSADYAKAIVGFLEKFYQNCQLPSLAGVLENKSQMKRRIANIVHYKRYSQKLTIAAVALFISTGFVFYLFTGVAEEKKIQPAMDSRGGKPFVEVKSVRNTEKDIESTGIVPVLFVSSHIGRDASLPRLAGGDVSTSDGKTGQILEVERDEQVASGRDKTFLNNLAGASDEAAQSVRKQPLKTLETFTPGEPLANISTSSIDQNGIVGNSMGISTNTEHRPVKENFIVAEAPGRKPELKSYYQKPKEAGLASLTVSETTENAGGESLVASSAQPSETSSEKKSVAANLDESLMENGSKGFDQHTGFHETIIAAGYDQGRVANRSASTAFAGDAEILTNSATVMFPESGSLGAMVKKDRAEESDGSGFLISNVDIPPRVIRAASPQYPYKAKRDEITGYIKLRFIVTKDGDAVDTTVVESSPEGVFDKSALEAIESYRFKPGMKDGKAVDVQVSLPIKFTIS